VFDHEDAIPLSMLQPSKIVELEVEHPSINVSGGTTSYRVDKGLLKVAAEESSESALWVGGFNPYGTYDVSFAARGGNSGRAGIEFATPDNQNRLSILAGFQKNECTTIHWRIIVDGEEKQSEIVPLKEPVKGPFTLRVQLIGTKLNVLVEQDGVNRTDRGDGLLRNDLASNIFYDRNADQWRGFTTGFSAYGDPSNKERKEIWTVQSSKEPLQGISIMKAKPTGLIGDFEDPQCIYDSTADKWRMLLCENHKGYKAVLRESDTWNGTYEKIAGPVEVNSTGTQIQKIGQKRYALFGSADRRVYIYTYPDLKPAGELKMHLPPWNDKTGTRVWPNVIPLPEGYPARYIALMMDRLNFPGMTGANWTYGAMYLYHAHPADSYELDYEYK
jgi:hypothetical protein